MKEHPVHPTGGRHSEWNDLSSTCQHWQKISFSQEGIELPLHERKTRSLNISFTSIKIRGFTYLNLNNLIIYMQRKV